MPRSLLTAVIWCFLTVAANASPDIRAAQYQSPGEQCRQAIAAAERGHGIPPQLQAAIGRIESGKRDPGTGAWGAWPWTINAEGVGSYFNSKAEAIQAVLALQARGVRSIDVGCMQVNLMYHPTAFPSLDLAFEPAVNADYAARFLVRLHDQSGDWNRATASYHSANPWEGDPYAAKVNSVWPEEQRKAGLAPPPQLYAATGMMPYARFDARAPVRPGMLPMGMVPLGVTPGSMAQPAPPLYPVTAITAGGPRTWMRPAGVRAPGLISAGFAQAAPPSAGKSLPPILPPEMMAAGTGQSGQLTHPGPPQPVTTQAAVAPTAPANGQIPIGPGRGLAFYRSAPITVGPPIRQAAPVPYRLSSR